MRLPSSLLLTILVAAAAHTASSSCSVSEENHYQSNNKDDTCSNTSSSLSPFAIARNLSIPLAIDIQDAEFEHSTFWEEHGPLLQDAWREWEDKIIKNGSFTFTCIVSKNDDDDDDDDDDGILTNELSIAIKNAFNNPNEFTESIVKSLWMTTDPTTNQPHLPKGVYATQLLTLSGIQRLRYLLDLATFSNIPTRRPNGMNRNGIIIDHNVAGAVSMKSLITLIEDEIINRVVRPIGRMLFPDRIGCNDDVEYFAFTIRYDDDGNSSDSSDERSAPILRDTELKEHRDASIFTLNVNLNLPEEEEYSGSEVFFREFPSVGDDAFTEDDDNVGIVRFTPGMAIVHLGAHRHGSLPITTTPPTSGNDERSSVMSRSKRYNLVIWLFGKDGDVRIAPYKMEEQMNVMQRWRGCNYTREDQFEL